MGEFRRNLLKMGRGRMTADFVGKVTEDSLPEEWNVGNAWGGGARFDLSPYVDGRTRRFAIDTSRVSVNVVPKFSGASWIERIERVPSEWAEVNGFVFTGCANLEYADLSGCDFGGRTSLYRMFSSCGKLKTVLMPEGRMEQFVGVNEMFASCVALESVDLSAVRNVSDMNRVFNGCKGLRGVRFAEDMSYSGTGFLYVFTDCKDLEGVDLGTADFGAVNNQGRAFWCGNPGPKSIRIRGIGGNEKTDVWKDCFRCPSWGDGGEDNRQSILYSLLEHSCDRTANGWETAQVGLPQAVLDRITDDEKAAIGAKGYSLVVLR